MTTATVAFADTLPGLARLFKEEEDVVTLGRLKEVIHRQVQRTLGQEDCNALFEHCEREEYDANTFYEEFKEPLEDCALLDEWKNRAHSKQEVYDRMRLLLAIDKVQLLPWLPWLPSTNTSVFAPYGPEIARMTSSLRAITDGCLTSHDIGVMRLAAAGQKKGVASCILLRFYDVYCRYRLAQVSAKIYDDGSFVGAIAEPKDFCANAEFVQPLPAPTKRDIISALETLAQTMPVLRLKRGWPSYLIDDDIHAFIEYTTMVQEITASQLRKAGRLPMQIDLVILPRKSVMVDAITMAGPGGSVESDSDNDSDDDDDEKRQFYASDAKGIIDVMAAFNAETESEVADGDGGSGSGSSASKFQHSAAVIRVCVDKRAHATRAMSNELRRLFPGEWQHSRFVVLIDRRKGEVQDECVVYQVPQPFATLSSEHTLLNGAIATMKGLIPCERPGAAGAHHFSGARNDDGGHTFVVSFQCLDDADHIRMHCTFNGGGMRFLPVDMFGVWPQLFKHMEQLDASKYNAQFLQRRWLLNTRDAELEQWCASI